MAKTKKPKPDEKPDKPKKARRVPATPEARALVLVKAEERAEKRRGKTSPDDPIDMRLAGSDIAFGKEAHKEEFVCRHPDGTIEMQWLTVPDDKIRCIGKIRIGPYKGGRCRKTRILGAEVCISHGGNLENVRTAARRRLLAATDLASAELIRIALSDRNASDADKLKAIGMILDRGGVDGKSTITLEVKPWEEVLKAAAKKKTGKSKTIIGEISEDDE